MRRAKIVCTLGPATSTPERIRELVEAGMDVARLNLSHGTYEDHERVYRMVWSRHRRLPGPALRFIDLLSDLSSGAAR